MTSVLACDPDELQATAHGLRRAAAELDVAAAEVLGAGDATWSGLAALEQAARRAEAATLVRQLAPPLEQVAAGLVEIAAAAREQGETVRRHARLRDELALEHSRLLALGAPPEPLAAAHWVERAAILEEERAWHQRLVDAAEQEFDRVERTVTQSLEHVRGLVPQIVWDLGVFALTLDAVRRGRRQVVAVVSMADAVRRVYRMPVPGGERTLDRMSRRVEHHLRQLKLSPPGWVAKVPGGAGLVGRAVPAMAAVDALPTLWNGGGYEGWRGGVTRTMAGVALVGVGVALAAPAAATVGLLAAAGYQAWMTGNWVYDNRQRIAGAASRAWTGTRDVAGRASSWGRGLVGRARTRAASGLGRLRARLGGTSAGRGDRSGAVLAPGPAPVGATA